MLLAVTAAGAWFFTVPYWTRDHTSWAELAGDLVQPIALTATGTVLPALALRLGARRSWSGTVLVGMWAFLVLLASFGLAIMSGGGI